MAPLLRFQAVERGFAHVAERRSPQAGISSSLAESVALQAAPTPAFLERRDTITGPSGAPVVSIPSLTNSAKALTGIIVVLAIVVLGVAVYKLRGCIRRREPSRSRSLKPLSLCASPIPEKIISEKRNQLYPQVLIDLGYDGLQPLEKAHLQHPTPPYADMDMTVGWVPQIRSRLNGKEGAPRSLPALRPAPESAPPIPPAPVVQRASRLSRLVAAVVRTPLPTDTSFHIVPLHSPPSSASSKSASPISASPAASTSSLIIEGPHSKKQKKQKQKPPRLIRPGTPHSKTQHVVPAPPDNLLPVITIAEVTRLLAAAELSAEPLKSPSRLDSARPAQAVQSSIVLSPKPLAKRSSRSSNKSTRIASTYENLRHAIASTKSPDVFTVRKSVIGAADRKLPRLVVVVHLFKPSMPDELLVRRGEVLQMTEEFFDGWCEVQRLSGTGSEMEIGVVPRFCVADRLTQSQPQSQPQTLGSRFSASTTYAPISQTHARDSAITTRSSIESL